MGCITIEHAFILEESVFKMQQQSTNKDAKWPGAGALGLLAMGSAHFAPLAHVPEGE